MSSVKDSEREAREEVEDFFKHTPVPENFAESRTAVAEFVQKHQAKGSKVVCITSGGTTVPFEKNTVRFLDNFSSGNRGATCSEYFLKEGYAVILLSRVGSAAPYARKLQKLISSSYDLKLLNHLNVNENGKLSIEFGQEKQKSQAAAEVVKAYKSVCEKQMLLQVDFTTLGDYLILLKMIAESVKELSAPPLFLLAAAVSDFYIPYSELETHKIQSGSGLALDLQQVPKLLGVLKKQWAPESMVISFKLETDHNILIQKAKGAIDKYGVDLVVANELHTRYEEVFIVSGEKEEKISRGESIELEIELVHTLAQRHSLFCSRKTE
mmetsp:Transcript_13025/g.15810  ORF Transcript_13025/g.15810 Transcript_13025/m.15810 type:complete len:325 (-) Transcript_13025:942-1916(-)|eukprot:CAMPEP_0184019350 /NCGR_PEP_ID=MMETSP0954-20121128/8699_1 /TAXON_ID=627963 /ORGANISM="Aplanochytrium sp, Strain PBS07" /LENGTH=324 /DNA_ID=CAMNT_0026300999 /DNA_START=53 /DNA_END=1027 /DNA_ORIENTATION=-